MSDMEDVLDRQERERRARMRRRAASKRAQRELDEQLGVAVALMEEENQSRRGSREGRASSFLIEWRLVQDYRRTRWNNLEFLTILHHLPTMGFPRFYGCPSPLPRHPSISPTLC
ncbi:unnamed protein product [Prunus armeniaca]